MINAQGLRCKIVPELATEEMLSAADNKLPRFEADECGIRTMGRDGAAYAYNAMLSAAPAFEPHPDVVERVARAIEDAAPAFETSLFKDMARAAISAFVKEG